MATAGTEPVANRGPAEAATRRSSKPFQAKPAL